MSSSETVDVQKPGRVARTGGADPTGAAKREIEIALLTGGADKPYALGLAEALAAQSVSMDFIGSDEIDGPQLHATPLINFLNLRGNQQTKASRLQKTLRVLKYYLKLIRYAASAKAGIFHILWNNKFELFDRTVLMLYYKLLGKRIVFTAHNVNVGKRDGNNTFLNRFGLRIQYHLADHIFVHAEKMKDELLNDFNVGGSKVSVIPFGINNTLPNTPLTTVEAKRTLKIRDHEKTLLFFGNIAPYKGLDYLIPALAEVVKRDDSIQLIIAGRPKGCEPYWKQVQQLIAQNGVGARIIEKIEYISDEQVELYFKAADALVLPYNHVFQSGVLFLGYSFGLPAIVTDVGALKEEIVEGKTGFACRPQDPHDLARAIETCFASELFKNLAARRREIQTYANERYSWNRVGELTREVYSRLLPEHDHSRSSARTVDCAK